ncbi:MAG: HEPN domain-containing protein [Nanoarchaeota archaeon]
MKEYDLRLLVDNPGIVDEKIKEFADKGIVKRQDADPHEIQGHLQKAEHNLRFISEVIKLRFHDWAITGCYYACYHAASALILKKGYSSKNHLATLCVLIKEFYKKELSEEDIELFSRFLDYQDMMFYVESKNKREDATYSTKTLFDPKESEPLRVKAALFVSKIKSILGES